MMTISPDSPVCTVVTLFTTKPGEQQSFLNLFEVSVQSMRKQPGFLGASLHKSLDGRTILNYMQWRSQDEFEAYVNSPGRAAREQEFHKLAAEHGYEPPDRRPYQVVLLAERPE